MRKILFIFSLIGFTSAAAFAQTVQDAFRISENDYEGTARSVAMGNAVTALGGDLGSVNINPAAAVVAPYSQITLTPGLTIGVSKAQGVSQFSDGDLPYFQREMRSTRTRFAIPNIGFSINFDTGRTRGVKNIAVGLTVNSTNNWNESIYAGGTNTRTSYLGDMAFGANGYLSSELISDDAFNIVPWKAAIGYNLGMISTYGGYNDQYVGATEVPMSDGSISFGDGTLKQTLGIIRSGQKHDYVVNVGMNVSDVVYIGANLGITSVSYSYSDFFKEAASSRGEFGMSIIDGEGNEIPMYFNKMTYRTSYDISGSGVYGKIGIIAKPVAGLRLGAAIQTPAINYLSETFQESGEVSFTGEGGYDANETSPMGRNRYTLSSPFRANLGAAYTIGKLGLVSVDYEVCNYGKMRYRAAEYDDDLADINSLISQSYATSHMFRAGLEFKPVDFMAVRAGYGFTTSPETALRNEKFSVKARQNVALGLGFSTSGSFFVDLAVKYTLPERTYIKPYGDYVGTFDSEGNFIPDNNYLSPLVGNVQHNVKVLLTCGWRF